MTFQIDNDLLCEHRAWLKNFKLRHSAAWENSLATAPEAASFEAAVRRFFERNRSRVLPNEIVNGLGKSPDFYCESAGESFFVEATSISIEKATEITGLSHHPKSSFTFGGIGRLTDQIFEECRSKTRQCSDLPHPVVLAIGTFHFQASHFCLQRKYIELLLTGETLITQDIDPTTGGPHGESYLSTKLRSATFLRPNATGLLSLARSPISAVLACGFGCEPPVIRAALHPQPARPINPKLLSGIESCCLSPGFEKGALQTRWL